MGQQFNHKRWFKDSRRKILVLCYNDLYVTNTIKALSNENLKMDDVLGYTSHTIKYGNFDFELWYLSNKNRHFWMHHYPGAQGVIMNFSFDEEMPDERIVFDALNTFFDPSLIDIPITVIRDQKCVDKLKLFPKLKAEWDIEKRLPEHKKAKADVKFFEVNLDKGIEGSKEALDWLTNSMKAL